MKGKRSGGRSRLIAAGRSPPADRSRKASRDMHYEASVDRSLADDIINQVGRLTLEAEDAGKPLEIDPYRGRLFELFVTADGAGYLDDAAEPDLTADGLCRELAGRWGLADAARQSVAAQSKLPPEQLAKMRLLWSVMRMWMEWTYAWHRWEEFHATRQTMNDE